MKKYTLIGPFKQILTMTGLPLKGPLSDEQLPILENGGIIMVDDKIHAIGPYPEIQTKANHLIAQNIPIQSNMVCLPG